MNSSIRQLLVAQCLTDFKSKFYSLMFRKSLLQNTLTSADLRQGIILIFFKESYEGKESIKYLWMQHALFMYNKVRRIKSLQCSNIDYSFAQHGNKKIIITDLYFCSIPLGCMLILKQDRKKRNTILRILFTNRHYEVPIYLSP